MLERPRLVTVAFLAILFGSLFWPVQSREPWNTIRAAIATLDIVIYLIWLRNLCDKLEEELTDTTKTR